ncbi:DUF6153 family protein [Nocardia alni]|uniref:DUF6153 family protein n=1 Tax=Nocardia alni TaxID=2815723 RepID=UPI001C230C3D|nr:DUF6153 family protein [Nocardia alni]
MNAGLRHLAPGYVRAAGLLVLLAGVAIMHILVVAPSHHMSGDAAAQTISVQTRMMDHITPTGDHVMSSRDTATSANAMAGQPMPARTGLGCDGCGCGMHGGMHACVFILTLLALTLGLVLLGRIGADPYAGARTARHRLSRRTRPPPWTMPSLAELSILRI